MTDIKTSKCNTCNKKYPATKEFFYTSRGKLKTNKCKPCKRQQTYKYQRDNKLKVNAYQKAYRNAYNNHPDNIEQVKKYRRERYKINKFKKSIAKAVKIDEITRLTEELSKYMISIKSN